MRFLWYTILFFIIITAFWKTDVQAQNSIPQSWSQFRGPGGAGHVQDEFIAHTPKLKLVWEQEIGSAYSELLVRNDVLFTMSSDMIDSLHGNEYILAFNAQTGAEKWRCRIDSLYFEIDGWGHGPRSTPVLHDDLIFCLSGNGKLSAHKTSDGTMLWQNDFVANFQSTRPRWGYSSSPLIVNEMLVVEVGGKDNQAFMAFDPLTGKPLWNSQNGEPFYNSPLYTQLDGEPQILFASNDILYSLKPDGDTLWTFKMPFRLITTMPLMVGKNSIFLSGVRTPGFVIIEVDQHKIKEIARGDHMQTDFNTASYQNGFIFGFNVSTLRCISAITGELKWSKRGFGKGSQIIVNKHMVVLSDQGLLVVAEANPDAFVEIVSAQAIKGKSWTAPSYARGKVYVRNLTGMACYQMYE
ncbi:MAG TPA: PQQ-binding-like beta-propeller repeat protein [Saprospiraceae bacterium]|nr:PQQ-binding-like beta-propeller repeat protein [Saprospiraceae bacterium]